MSGVPQADRGLHLIQAMLLRLTVILSLFVPTLLAGGGEWCAAAFCAPGAAQAGPMVACPPGCCDDEAESAGAACCCIAGDDRPAPEPAPAIVRGGVRDWAAPPGRFRIPPPAPDRGHSTPPLGIDSAIQRAVSTPERLATLCVWMT